MLSKLIESVDTGRHRRKFRKYVLSVGTLVSSLFVCGLVFSIFNTNLAMGTGSIELSALVAPAPIPEKTAPEPESLAKTEKQISSSTSRLPARAKNIQRTDEVPVSVPKSVSVAQNKFKARPTTSFVISAAGDRDGTGNKKAGPGKVGVGRDVGFGSANGQKIVEAEKAPAIVKKTATPPPALRNVIVSGGVVNGKAKVLVKPVMSAAAKAVGARGKVEVSVLISESGRVVSANASGGHAMLRPLAVDAALKSTFSPTYVSRVPVKVSGKIIYNFH